MEQTSAHLYSYNRNTLNLLDLLVQLKTTMSNASVYKELLLKIKELL